MNSFKLMTLLISLFVAVVAQAEQFKAVDDYEIHYNAFNSSAIPPAVANSYALQRGKYRALMNVAVLKRDANGKAAENAVVTGTKKNLIGQIETLKFTEIREGDSIYYITSFRFTDDELLMFDLSVQPNPNNPPYSLSFKQQFYAD